MTAPGPTPDLVRDVLDLAAVALADGRAAEWEAQLELLVRTPRESLEVLAAVLVSLSRPDALADVRYMAVLHSLRQFERGR